MKKQLTMEINYEEKLAMALKANYPDVFERNEVKQKLKAYGTESFHREQARVQLGILYLASREPDKLDSFIEMACADYRDLLCAAEYPYSSGRWKLRKKDPEKYKKFQEKEKKEYMTWIGSLKQE